MAVELYATDVEVDDKFWVKGRNEVEVEFGKGGTWILTAPEGAEMDELQSAIAVLPGIIGNKPLR